MEICCKKALKAEAKNPYIYEKQAKACKLLITAIDTKIKRIKQ
ncbi:hypothetical protein C7960_2155 [Methanohalophilus euhalobius]|uniref:Uncharacterized protein n=1 Tax=Methanohalophilus euhalobius TaxID=51203 RepID=A0A483E0G1_9EURY|nr:hypothetical protein [Methanohalophilus euhalobius]TCL12870.1 hypothetical protein C7960_2155 [Methanohalophilus euhalobius]